MLFQPEFLVISKFLGLQFMAFNANQFINEFLQLYFVLWKITIGNKFGIIWFLLAQRAK